MDDRIDAGTVEVTVDDAGKVWVNIDGVCAVRVGQARVVRIESPGHKVEYEFNVESHT